MSIEPSSLRVVDLRKELSSRGLSTNGKKKELIKRLTKALAKEEPTENTANVPASTTDNLSDKPQNELNLAATDEEKPSEVTSIEQKVESIHEEKLVDKPAEETNEQHIEQLPTPDLTNKSTEITSEQKVELTQDPTEKPINEVPKEEHHQVIEESVVSTTLPQESALENPVDIVLSTNTVQVEVVQQPAVEEPVNVTQQQQQLSAESLIEKPQEQIIEKESIEQLIEKPIDSSIAELLERPVESLVKASLEELDEHRNTDSMRSREQMVTPPRDDEEIKMSTNNIFAPNDGFKIQDSMALGTELGAKRKADEELHEEPDKRQKTTITDNDTLKCAF